MCADPSNDGREGDSEIFGHVGGWSAIGENQAGRNSGLSGVSEGPQSEITFVEGAGEGYGVLHRAPGPADISQGHLHEHPKSPALPLRVRNGNRERERFGLFFQGLSVLVLSSVGSPVERSVCVGFVQVSRVVLPVEASALGVL